MDVRVDETRNHCAVPDVTHVDTGGARFLGESPWSDVGYSAVTNDDCFGVRAAGDADDPADDGDRTMFGASIVRPH
jgi:hypothetical protein